MLANTIYNLAGIYIANVIINGTSTQYMIQPCGAGDN